MNPSCLDHRLTEDERRSFNLDGYLILEDTLTAEEVERLTGVVDGLHAAGKFAEGRRDETISGRINKAGFVGLEPIAVRPGRVRADAAEGVGNPGLERISVPLASFDYRH